VEDVEGMIRGVRAAGMDVTAMVSELGTNSDGFSMTPLMAAAAFEQTTTIVQLLLNNMKLEDINHKNTDGNTPLDLCYKYNKS
jgi:hypothetical protein